MNFKERVRAYHEEIASEHDRYRTLTRDQRDSACTRLQAIHGINRPWHISEILGVV